MRGWMYILKRSNDSLYVGSTNNLDRRIDEHQSGEGAKHTAKYLPVELVYFEEFSRVQDAFYREHQVKKWSRAKKLALIAADDEMLSKLAKKKWK